MEVGRIPNKLKFFRHCSGYSQKKVAVILGLSDTSTLSRWEHGVNFPSIKHVFKLCRIYQTIPQDLFDKLWEQSDKENNLLVLDIEPFNSNERLDL